MSKIDNNSQFIKQEEGSPQDQETQVDNAATVNLTLFSENKEPIQLTIDVLAESSESETGIITINSLDTSASKGIVSINQDGTIRYDANGQFDYLRKGEQATDSFSYKKSDGNGGFDEQEMTVVLTGTKDGPTFTILLVSFLETVLPSTTITSSGLNQLFCSSLYVS